MLGPEALTDTASAGHTPRIGVFKEPAETAAIGLIHQHTLERLLSPELMLVDAELAERARALLREPQEANGKGTHMSALGTHEFTAGASLGLEPPLSPPVVRGPVARQCLPATAVFPSCRLLLRRSGLPRPLRWHRPPSPSWPRCPSPSRRRRLLRLRRRRPRPLLLRPSSRSRPSRHRRRWRPRPRSSRPRR